MTRLRKILQILIVIAMTSMIVVAIINVYVVRSSSVYVKNYEEFEGHYDYIIVLGCGIIDNQYPTDLMVDRLDTAIRLYNNGASDRILLSGDHQVNDYNEVAVMKNYMLARGIPEEVIDCDDLGLSTSQTMRRASGLFGVRSAVIVTQKYHLYRSVYLAKHYGIDCEGVIATGHTFVAQPYYSAREYLARVKDFLLSIVF